MFYKIFPTFIFIAIFLTSTLAQTLLSNKWIVYDKTNSPLPSNKINWVQQDRNGTYWIACSPEYISGSPIGGGLVKFDGYIWQVYNTSNSPLPNNNIDFLVIDSMNNVWIAIGNAGIAKFDGFNWQFFF
jgi:hypothetical protein